MPTGAQASAPCALPLARRVGLALDRRVSCLVTPAEGLELESKDALARLRVERLEELRGDGVFGWLEPLLQELGTGAGQRIVTHARVPEASGLGVRAALAAAVAAALVAFRGEPPVPESLAERLRAGLPQLAPVEAWAALLGGIVSLEPGGAGERVAADPARVEERLLLVESGLDGPAPASAAGPGRESDGEELLAALRAGRYQDLGGLLGERPGSKALPAGPAALAERARALGGSAWLVRPGAGALLAIWSEPDARRELLEAARKAGLRPVACRLDLLGLEVETSS